MSQLDDLDVRIIELLANDPRVSAVDAAATLGVARATYQSRLDRLTQSGSIALAPTLTPEAAGFTVTAFINAEIRQSSREHGVIDHLLSIPEVIEAHTVTGGSDLLIRVVATSNQHLQKVLDAIARHDDVLHTSTSIALANQIPARTVQLARHGLAGGNASTVGNE